MKSFFLILPLLAILGITLWWAVSAWNAVDVEMSIHGYIATAIAGAVCFVGALNMARVAVFAKETAATSPSAGTTPAESPSPSTPKP